MPRTRRDKGHYGSAYRRLRSQVLVEEDYCYLCGYQVDKNLHYLDPHAPQVHFIEPVARGGSWRDRRNARLTHSVCNRKQSDHWDGTVDHTGRGEYSWVVAYEEP